MQKSDNQILLAEDFYGGPQCGLIGRENNWAIVAGIHLIFWTPNSETRYQTGNFRDIHAIRLKDKETVEILTDPWAKYSAIWEINLENGGLIKVEDFIKYKNAAYTENVKW